MSGQIVDLSPAYIEPSPDNPRRDLGDLTELAASIANKGIIEPLVVRPIGRTNGHERYQVIVGHRRLAAAEAAGSMWVPCIVREYDDEARAEIMLIENLQRVDLSPIEEAAAFQRLVDDFGWSQDKLAERIGRSQSHVSKRLSLLHLSGPALDALDSGGITIADALELTKLASHPERLERVVEAATNGYEPGQTGYADVAWKVKQEIDEIDEEAKYEKLVATAQKGKVPFLEAGGRGDRPHVQVPSGSKELVGYDGLGMTTEQAKAHASKPCHAVTVLFGYAGVRKVPICTKPKSHDAELGRERERQLSPAEQAAREQDRQLKAAAKARLAFVRTLSVKVGRSPIAEELIFDELVNASHQLVLKIACELLEVEPVREETSWGSTQLNYAGLLRDLAGKSSAERQRVAVAVVFAAKEEGARTSWYGWHRMRPYFALLQGHGYEPSEAELTKLAEAENDAGAEHGAEHDPDFVDESSCRVCGCTEENACEGGCTWVDDPDEMGELCSACLDRELEEAAVE